MSAYHAVGLFCDARSEPTESFPRGNVCTSEFTSLTRSFAEVRAKAAEAGWTYVRHPYRRHGVGAAMDKDFCPNHKPESSEGDR